jgi:hypothetical protein
MSNVVQVLLSRKDKEAICEIVAFVNTSASVGMTFVRDEKEYTIQKVYKTLNSEYMSPADCLYRDFKRT